jgi:hypothetical protein
VGELELPIAIVCIRPCVIIIIFFGTLKKKKKIVKEKKNDFRTRHSTTNENVLQILGGTIPT